MVYHLLEFNSENFYSEETTITLEIAKLEPYSTFDECAKKFHSDMIFNFSQYGESLGKIGLLDIECTSVHGFSFVTDGTILAVNYDYKDHKSPKIDQFSYAVSGGLCLGFVGLIINHDTLIRYSFEELKVEELGMIKTGRELTHREQISGVLLPRNKVLKSQMKIPKSRMEILESQMEVLKSQMEILKSQMENSKCQMEVLKCQMENLDSQTENPNEPSIRAPIIFDPTHL